MDLDDFIITAFCMIDDTMKQLFANIRLRQRGPSPALSDSETLTMEIVGEYLSLNQDKAIYDYFRRHYSHFFPAMAKIHRTTFVRQAANLWRVKEMVWQRLLKQVRYDPSLKLVASSLARTDVADSGVRLVSDTIQLRVRPSTAFVCTLWWPGPVSSSVSE